MKKILMTLTLMPFMAFATTWYVNGTTGSDGNVGTSESTAKATIQAAIDVSKEGDVVFVSAGTYAPISSNNKRLTIESCQGAANTIIDGKKMARCANLSSIDDKNGLTNTVLIGFTLKDGKISTEKFGGCLFWGMAKKCVIRGGEATSGGGAAASILEDCLICDNSAVDAGGCDCCVIRNCTIVNNYASHNGAAYSTSVIENTIVYGNVGYTEEFDGSGLGWGNELTRNLHRINVFTGDPKFVDAGNGDYRLAADSPCIDAGDNVYVHNSTDLGGNVRIANGTVDIGCYEYGACRVRFDLGGHGVRVGGGELTQVVQYGQSAVAPNVNSYIFAGWDKAFDKVTGDMTVTARYVVVTNSVEMVEPEATVVSDQVADFEPATGFDGSAKRTYNGIAYDGDGKLCGLVQIATAKESKSGVKVSGYVMLSDGKKLTIKSVNGSVADGLLVAETSVGKVGKLALTIGSDGFRGVMDEMTLVTANISEAGVVKGNLTVNYIEEKTNKWKTKTATVNGVAAEGTAAGTIKVKKEKDKSFLTVVE